MIQVSLGFLLELTLCDSRIPHNMHEKFAKFGFIASYRSPTLFRYVSHVQLDVVWSTCCLPQICDTSCMPVGMSSFQNFDQTTLSKDCVSSTTTNNFLFASSYTNLESWICIKDLSGSYSRLPWHQPSADSMATVATPLLHTKWLFQTNQIQYLDSRARWQCHPRV